MLMQLELSSKWSFQRDWNDLYWRNIRQNITGDKEDHYMEKIQSSPAYHNALHAQAQIPQYYLPSAGTIVFDLICRTHNHFMHFLQVSELGKCSEIQRHFPEQAD